ncbi:MAG: hypothetical protein OH319_03315 [Candidatus Parvarchaeota archaeon]|nr:hypothetical protein [Candidatus Jingweiarchaeum tengchongense]MCW1298524.1 hypothetical protein [Candidatus Jingweiarchaeum tengchongense]MCW1300230.1 hypothetical protein [Candidatus Jingweiarchaeum tengchongense]MCW1304536.1 hypothetical protein [Candidatus Jingweiarchaeum tengchongense]MCW1305736.1 hypothetical protein [Candidatus Jingweiarchaeum tengchongense]
MINRKLEMRNVYQIIDGSRQLIQFGNETLDKLINETSFNKKVELFKLMDQSFEKSEEVSLLLEEFKGKEFSEIYIPIVIAQPYAGKKGEMEIFKWIKSSYKDSIVLNEDQLLKIIKNLHEKRKHKNVIDYLIINRDYIIGIEVKGKTLQELRRKKENVWRKLKRFRTVER